MTRLVRPASRGRRVLDAARHDRAARARPAARPRSPRAARPGPGPGWWRGSTTRMIIRSASQRKGRGAADPGPDRRVAVVGLLRRPNGAPPAAPRRTRCGLAPGRRGRSRPASHAAVQRDQHGAPSSGWPRSAARARRGRTGPARPVARTRWRPGRDHRVSQVWCLRRAASRPRMVWSSTTLRRRTATGVTSTHSSSRQNSSACSSESLRGGISFSVSSRGRRAHVGELLLLGDVDVHVVGAGVLADDHALVHLGGRLDEQRAALLQVDHRERRSTAPARSATSEPLLRVRSSPNHGS